MPGPLIVGRSAEIAAVTDQLREGVGTLLDGPRRIGKTTVCGEVCRILAGDGFFVVKIDVPERPDSGALLSAILDACHKPVSGARALKALRPSIEKYLQSKGLPLDLTALSATEREQSARAILGLPLALAEQRGQQGLVFFDELQRVADYADSQAVLADLTDLYGTATRAVVLADGSQERTMNGLLGPPASLGKLVKRIDLPPTISAYLWRDALTQRFADAGLRLPGEQRDRIIAWGAERPYQTMAAARHTALAARQTSTTDIGVFDVQMGIDAAERQLNDDGA